MRPKPTGLAAIPPLIARLDALAERAEREHWPGWRYEDSKALESVVRDLAAIPGRLEQHLRGAFELGLRQGRQEELMARVEREIIEETVRLGQKAWGREAAVGRRNGSRP